VAVCEVKARADGAALEEPLAAVQRDRIARAARAFLAARQDLADHAIRFDLLTVRATPGRMRVRHLPGAFEPPNAGYGSNRRSSG
jgi:Holliday junction resolvase-like predicted endonuclease